MSDDIFENVSVERVEAISFWIATATELETYEYANRGVPRCEECGRVSAAADCERPDVTLCWFEVDGADSRCELLRTQ